MARRSLPWFLSAALGALLLALFAAELLRGRERPAALPEEGCLSCHEAVDVSPSHPADFGCVSCHLGDPLYLDEERAHRGMLVRPSELAVAERSCGRSECHPDQLERVSAGLMASNAGIATVLAYQFGEAPDPDGGAGGILASGVPGLLASARDGRSLAEDHFRKFCATCHLHKRLGDMPGEIGTRGGGCADCHLERPAQAAGLPPVGQPGWAGEGEPGAHPLLTTRIRTGECVKCHNRSARIGLSYQGQFEDEAYATPYAQGGPSLRELSGGRSWQPLLPDVHAEAGMVCIDCHLGAGVMGDGEPHRHMEEQVAIACQDCHRPRWSAPLVEEGEEESLDFLALRSASLNPGYQLGAGDRVGVAFKGDPIPHLQPTDEGAALFGRVDGKAREVPLAAEAPYHDLAVHERLSCQACHSSWTPQCYGCHEVYDRGETQLDKLAGVETPGRWEERRSYLRFERPSLGIGPEGTVQPFAPGCQVFLAQLDAGGEPVDPSGEGDGSARAAADGAAQADPARFPALAMAAFDPHATRSEVPSCLGCHLDPKVLGLGDGQLRLADGVLRVAPPWDAGRSGLDLEHALDAFVDGQGRALQTTSRAGARPFSLEELRSILAVSACLPCHDSWEDPIWRDWEAAADRWRRDASLPCRGAP